MSCTKKQDAGSHCISEPIAIVGSACRFPGGCNAPSKLWDLLQQPRDILQEIDPDRLNLRRYYHPDGETHGSTDVANKAYTLQEDIGLFDASFFGISPLEAAGMDPQQRILLEVVYESLETAGITLDQLRGSPTSVHVGVMTNDWAVMQRRDGETMPQYTGTGIASSIISNRLSYVFDLRGASETIDTACSSSLVALHNAARALQSGDSDRAIVGGVNLMLDPDPFIFESKLHMLSPDARSRMWDASADGYARGEGAASLVLKTLSRALRDGDAIEGVLRSTCVNSDGLSSGLTMPSAAAQTALIRETYRKAGLDPARDRPQFFECHGTGTKAGDPVEARAISDAFIPKQRVGASARDKSPPLYVGSIKTVIGHLEGAAGLAGVVKVLLSLKHGVIAPNLWFNELNPDIAQYYGPLQIPTKAIPWPKLADGAPLRASVNSFGFGGTNAHAIIERYDASQNYAGSLSDIPAQATSQVKSQVKGQEQRSKSNAYTPIPILLTAKTGGALWRTVDAYAQHLRAHPQLSLDDLSKFLHARRSTHRLRAHFSGASRDEVLTSMEAFVLNHAIDARSSASESRIGYAPLLIDPKETPGVLGVFTGQGAQWPAMGRGMMEQSPLFRKMIAECESVLQALPAKDVPSWSLSKELAADAAASRLAEAELSQPLCTAVQLALVNVLWASGVHFDAVVGHSSGEIAAAYTSGIITLQGAMQIAYYRGRYAKLARGGSGQSGGMMAVGLSMAEAVQFCHRPEFEGCIQVAASNAPGSVTLSGGREAIQAAKAVLDSDGVFARELKVDTAYHSHHMLPCAGPYLESLLACDIQVRSPTPGKCVWSSSVRGDAELLRSDRSLDSLKGPYWVANMVQTVLFSRAVASTIWHGGPFDLAIEVGPHPALKGPTEQTLKAVYGSTPFYTGVLKRGSDDAVAFSTAIGSIWAHLGPAFVDLSGYQSVFADAPQGDHKSTPAFVSGLPSYSWDHEKLYWRESRISRRYRTGKDGSHELLGRRAPDDNEREVRWRNLLKVGELPWTQGHKILGEVLLPGAAYISMALDAGKRLATDRNREVQLLEVFDVDILRPVVVSDGKDGTETLFTVRLLEENPSTALKPGETLRASFSFYVFGNAASTSVTHTCEGQITVHLGARLGSTLESESFTQLPPRESVVPNLQELDCESIYSLFAAIGLDYSGAFRRISASRRQLGYATASASWPGTDLNGSYMIHPAILDVAFQTIFIARAHPDSGQINAALLPSRIERVRVVPSATLQSKLHGNQSINAEFDAWVLSQSSTSLTGNLNVYDADTATPLLQVEGFEVRTVGEPDASHDRPIFSETVWGPDISINGLSDPVRDKAVDATVQSMSEAGERVSLFYVRRLMDEITAQDREQANWYHARMLQAFDHHLALVTNDAHLHLRRAWLSDDWAAMEAIGAAYPDAVELQMLHAVGQNIASVIRGEKHMLEVMRVDNMLDRFYAEDKGMQQINSAMAEALRAMTFKFPRCKILEIGAGTGATSWSVLSALDDAFDTYTYTDLSVGFFETAMERFSTFRDKMVFKAFDVEKDLEAQGYNLHSYDIIIAANVLHATRNLGVTLRNVRSLLKPGGYLLLNEKTGPESLRATFNFGPLEGWWLAEEADRQLSPLMSPLGWEVQLQKAQFSGVDHVFHDIPEEPKQQTSLMVSQAVDDMFCARLSPLSDLTGLPPMREPLLIIGGQTAMTSRIMKEIQKLLPRQWKQMVRLVDSVENLAAESLAAGSDVICLQELDQALFSGQFTEARLSILQTLLMNTKNLLWVTNAQNSTSATPRSSMFRGITRVLDGEVPQIRIQCIGVEPVGAASATARSLLEAFLRLRLDNAQNEVDAEGDGAGDVSRQVLWSHEPEVDLLSNGAVLIPRVKLNKTLNHAYIASTRAVSKTVDASCVSVEAVAGPTKMVLQAAQNTLEQANPDQDLDLTVRVRVKYALHVPQGPDGTSLYLACGWRQTAETSGTASIPVMILSRINASIIDVASTAVILTDEGDVNLDTLLRTFEHLSSQALEFAAQGQHQQTLVYGADEALAASISERCALRGNTVHFASSRVSAPADWLHVHPLTSKFTLGQMIPTSIQTLINCFGSGETDGSFHTLASCLPAACAVRHLDATLLSEMSEASATALADAYSYAKMQENLGLSRDHTLDIFQASELAGKVSHPLQHSVYITDWQKQDPVLVNMPPLKTQGMFKSDKTYLMVGAAGGVGTSLCRWMVRNGARHVVVTSRNPRGDPSMIHEAERYSAVVRVVAMDVCDRHSVQAVVDMIRATMPPIAGVCNAAMVLCDKLFLDMDVDQLNDTLGPKVDGTEILDTIFARDALDFFILLGSSATITNNVGQSNYHCANLYMDSLVAQRRSRGLAASIIHIGYICDTGYVARLTDDAEKIQSNRDVMRAMTLSETDVHHAFAQAVRGGSPRSSSGSHNIIMGIEPPSKPLDPSRRRALWLSDPRLGHMVPSSASSSQTAASEQAVSSNAVGQQVNEANTEAEAAAAVLQAFGSKLEAILLLPPGSIGESSAGRPVTDLGIDSLVAVEIRTWFLKQLRVDVPVMKILGGSTIGQLCTLAAKLARQGVGKESQSQDASAGKTEVSAQVIKDNSGDEIHQGIKSSSTSGTESKTLIESVKALLPAVPAPEAFPTNPGTSSSVSELDDSLQDSAQQSSETDSRSTPSKSSAYNSDSEPESKPQNHASSSTCTETTTAARPEILREAHMSPAQSRIWFLSKHIAEPYAYNMVWHYRVHGRLNMMRLRHAMQAVTNHHECLRMCFHADAHSGQPMQGLLASSALRMSHRPDCSDKDVQEALRQLGARSWSLEDGQTLELMVLSRPGPQEEHSLLFGYHHIVMDAISWHIFLADLDTAYRMLPLDRAAAGSHLELTERQLQQERVGAWDAPLGYWQAEFETIPAMLPALPMALPSLPSTLSKGSAERGRVGTHRILRELPEGQGDAIHKTCKHLRVSPFNLHLAVLQVLLARLADIQDVCVGIVDANRSDARASQMVGCFVNMLPIRAQVPRTATLAEVAKTASYKALAAFAHGAVPLDKILDRVKAPRPAGGTPLFQVALNYRPAASISWDQPLGTECQMELAPHDMKDGENPFEMSVLVSEMPGGGLAVEMYCQKAMYTLEGSRALMDAYLNVLGGFLSDTAQCVSDCAIYSQAEIERALDLGRGPQMDFAWPPTLSERVRNMCQRYSVKHAIKESDDELSYAQLASRVNDTAHALLSAGGSVGSRVAVLCAPSIDAIVAMLAILHVGAVYVPLDTSLPEARHLAMVSDSTPSIIVFHEATKGRVDSLDTALHSLDQEVPRKLPIDSVSSSTETAASLQAVPDAPAILLYTSGSTGIPKGVLLTQANFSNHIALKTDILGLDRGECVLQQSSLGFDMSLVQIFCALANGGCVVIVPADARRDPVELTSLMTRHKVSLTIATPSEYLAWLQYGSDSLAQNTAWTHLCMGGEPIPQLLRDELRRFGRKELTLTNCYGPTEATAAVSFQSVSLDLDSEGSEIEDELVRHAVGKALPNYSIRIMDAAAGWLPASHTGEIVVGGAGVALGYLGLPEETKAKFLQPQGKGNRFYRTGDKGRLLPDGTLLCFGRIEGDSQVKLRGLRIELQEVEAALLQASEGLFHTAVVSRRGDVLVAHCVRSLECRKVVDSNEQETAPVLRRLARLLPQYSVPAAIIMLSSLPTNANGKLDRKAIAALPLSQHDEVLATSSGGEKMTLRQGELRLLWERLLPSDAAGGRITPVSDFFLRGGNSLLLMKLQAAIRDAMGVRVSTKALYQASTLSGMSRCIAEQREQQRDESQVEIEIDWAAETAIPPSLLGQINKTHPSTTAMSLRTRKPAGLEILLTGATGFLGGQLLQRLLQAPQVHKVHCVAVPADEQPPQPPSEKTAYYTGHLAAPNLGLGAADRLHLEQSVDVIVHAGATGHCLNTYSTLSQPNLASTQTLCSLALARSPPIPFAFVSSSRVVLLTGRTSPTPRSVAAFPPPTDGAEGYTASKWASEAFLENVAAETAQTRPWRVAIHRPCVLVGEQAPNSDALNAILRFSVAMRCVPSLPRDRARGYLDFGQVDKVVAEMASNVLELVDGGQHASPAVTYTHHSGGVKVPIHEFRAHMESVYGGQFDSVDLSEWIARAVAAGMDPLISAYLETFLEGDAPMVFPYMGEQPV